VDFRPRLVYTNGCRKPEIPPNSFVSWLMEKGNKIAMKRALINILTVCLVIGPLGLVVTPPAPIVVAALTIPQAATSAVV
jgi:hypothetical protein